MTTTIVGRAPATILPVTVGQLRVLLVAHQAVDEAYGGGDRMVWDGPNNTLTFREPAAADGSTYEVAVRVRSTGAARSTVDVTATITKPGKVTPEERVVLQRDAQRNALQESRSMVAILMKQVAKGVGRGFADPAPRPGPGLAL